MASDDFRLEKGVISTTEPVGSRSTSPPGWKKAGAAAAVVGKGIIGATESKPSPVTGKRVTLVVDRYYLARGRKRARRDYPADPALPRRNRR